MKLRITIILFLFLSLGLQAQDVHYSMFQMAPIGLNPALAGSFSGTARVGGIYRVQDLIGSSEATAASRGYETYTAYLDVPVIRGIREQDWVGIGLSLTTDVAGIGNLKQTGTAQAISYHMPLGRGGKNTLSFAINTGTISYSVKKASSFRFETDITGQGVEPKLIEYENPENQTTKGDFGGGIAFKSNIDKVSAYRMGLSAAHVNSPLKRLGNSGGRRTPVRLTGFFEYDRLLNPRTRIIPAVVFQNYGSNVELAFQALTGYYLNPEKGITVYGGLGFRSNTLNPLDAIPIYIGFDMKDLQVRLAFDTTISGKSYTNRGFGALELSANYILKIYKRPKVDPAVFCPRF